MVLNFLDNKQIFDLFYFLDLEFTQEAKQCNITKATKYNALCIKSNNGKMEKYLVNQGVVIPEIAVADAKKKE